MTEWQSGANRFGLSDERLAGALDGDDLVGVCGLNRDPYAGAPDVGRLRHLFVAPASRRRGVAFALVEDLLASACRTFRVVRLRTGTPEATAFYAERGFVPVVNGTASHVRMSG